MRIGINGTHDNGTLAGIRSGAQATAAEGFASYWLGQAFGAEALTALAVVAPDAPGIGLGVAVVPIWTRSPQALAGQALTTQAATGGRLTLGIGLSHRSVVEDMWGAQYTATARRAEEYLAALRPLLAGNESAVDGETLFFRGRMVFDAGCTPPPVLLGALGDHMLRVAGAHADGTVTGSTGPRVLAEHIVPKVRAAAETAGRPAPRVVTNVVAIATDDADGAYAFLRERLAAYGEFESFKAMLDREGVASQADIALIGDERALADAVAEYERVGVTDLLVADLGRDPEESARTRAAFAALASTTRSN
jgi:F420-dependent oxidoreductase-like protein